MKPPRRPPGLSRLRMTLRARLGKKLSYRHGYVFSWLRPGDVTLDCGANVGKVTALMRAQGAQVHAFEPDPEAFAVLQDRFADDPQVVLNHAAVGAASGEAALYLRADRARDPVKASIGSSLYAENAGLDAGLSVTTRIIDIAAYVAALDAPVAALKMDIEGHEIAALGRLLDAGLHRRIGLGLIETHERFNPGLAKPTDALRARLRKAGAKQFYLNWR